MSTLEPVNSEDWQEKVLNSKNPVVVEFWHERCEWCKRLEPELEEVATEFLGRASFVKLNILSSPRNTLLSHEYGVKSTPTLILFCHGRLVEELVGYRQRSTLKNMLKDLIGGSDECLSHSTVLIFPETK